MELSQIDYYNFLAIRNNYLKPLNKFMSNDEIYLVINKYIFNQKFFPIPFFLTASLDFDILSFNKKSGFFFNGFFFVTTQ